MDKLAMTGNDRTKVPAHSVDFCWAPIAQLLLTDYFLIIMDVHLLTARPQQIGIPSIVMVVVHRNNEGWAGVSSYGAGVGEENEILLVTSHFHFNSADIEVLIPQ